MLKGQSHNTRSSDLSAGASAVPDRGYVKGSISQYFDHRARQLGHRLCQVKDMLKGQSHNTLIIGLVSWGIGCARYRIC